MNKNINTYQSMDSAGKSQPEILAKVYDGTIRKMREAIEFYEKEEYDPGYQALEIAKTALVHLYGSLDNEKGGEIAEQLGKLYAFVVERINFVQATKDTQTMKECIEILGNIRDGWDELAVQVKNKKIKPDSKKMKNGISVSI